MKIKQNILRKPNAMRVAL